MLKFRVEACAGHDCVGSESPKHHRLENTADESIQRLLKCTQVMTRTKKSIGNVYNSRGVLAKRMWWLEMNATIPAPIPATAKPPLPTPFHTPGGRKGHNLMPSARQRPTLYKLLKETIMPAQVNESNPSSAGKRKFSLLFLVFRATQAFTPPLLAPNLTAANTFV